DRSAMKDGGGIVEAAVGGRFGEPNDGRHLFVRQWGEHRSELTRIGPNGEARGITRVVRQAAEYRFGTAEDRDIVSFACGELRPNQIDRFKALGLEQRC